MYGSTTKGDVVKRSDCILVYGSTTKGDVKKRSDCILVYGSTTKGDVKKRSDCILVYVCVTSTLLFTISCSVPSSCTLLCQPVLIASTSDKKYRFGVPLTVLTKQVGLYLDGDNVMENREKRLNYVRTSISLYRLGHNVLCILLDFELLDHSVGG